MAITEARNTSSRGELNKINLEGCKICGRVYVSDNNAIRLRASPGWHCLENLQQKHPGQNGQDIVIRVRGRVWGSRLGQRVCDNCRQNI